MFLENTFIKDFTVVIISCSLFNYSALRRYQATHWLECLVGPLGIESQPSEKDFISCLRNGLTLCNLINKIEPGSVPKVKTTDSLTFL